MIQTTSEIGKAAANLTEPAISIWFWVATAELLIIGFLVYKIISTKNKLPLSEISKSKLKNAQKTDIDMNNIMNSIVGSRDLYKQLSRVCHPDRFINTDHYESAVLIFQEISKNKRNHDKLAHLQKRAETELNINFK
ncbi:hypothetical protein [Aestuariibaculum lutulentum]|uniref:J domain-containing protein n=1 Tax=Aestuariibaculum lutulentum TaxID=2920935 RepID=A0ABS9RGZ7_9FLAO|nr:hypothetical protein [Aestuariibaculum lutulentum]MCH4552216.1 hypothetical protein [Aestuariibaculum lutulentum]